MKQDLSSFLPMNSWYIHINQAVKKYNKTRQTFYNYIKKGYVATKKVNNKVFLKIQDIEKILNDYIESEQAIIEPADQNTINSSAENITKQIPDNTNNQSNSKSFSNNLQKILQQLEESILRSNKGQLYTNQQVIQWVISEKQWDVLAKLNELGYSIRKNSRRQRKTLFRMYYLVFVSINVFILRYIS